MKKKKFFSYLFLGLLAVGATGTVTSCKDYDDDINASNTRIDQLTSTASSLDSALNKAKSDLQAQINASTQEYNQKIAAAQASLQAAIDQKADQTSLQQLAQRVTDLTADRDAQIAGLQASLNNITTAISNLQATVATKVDQSAFNDAIAALQSKDAELQQSYNTLSSSKADKTALESLSTSLNNAITALRNSSATKTELAAVQALANDLKDGKLDNTTFNDYKTATQALIDGLTTRVGNLTTSVGNLESNSATKAELASEVQALNELIGTNRSQVDAAIASVNTAIKNLQVVVATKASNDDLTVVKNDLAAAKNDLATSVKNLQDQIDALKATSATKAELNAQVEKLNDLIAKNVAAINANAEGISKNAGDISKNAGDISTINSTLTTLRSDLTALQNLVDTKASKTDLDNAVKAINESLTGKVNVTDFQNFQKAYNDGVAAYTAWKGGVDSQLLALKNSSDSINTAFNTRISANAVLGQSLQSQVDALKLFQQSIEGANFQKQITDLQQFLSADAQKNYASISDRADSLANVLTATKADLATNAQAITTVQNDLTAKYNELTTKINENVANLNVLVLRTLNSLVLKPGYYYGGIEAVEVPSLQNYKSYKYAAGNTTNIADSITEEYTRNGNDLNISRQGIATYHVNPIIADLTGYTIAFYGNDPITRAGGTSKNFVTPVYNTYDALVKASSDNFTSEGLINVPFTVNFDQYNATIREGKTPMIALQMTKQTDSGVRTVTSDYAMLNVTNYKDLIIADNTFSSNTHVQQTVADLEEYHIFGQGAGQKVIQLSPQSVEGNHEIAVDSTLDFSKFVETHFTYVNPTSKEEMPDQLMPDATLKALGLSYHYALIRYTVPGFNKPENSYAILEGTKLKAKDKTAMGHQPIVRVTLEDEKGNVVTYGYIKVKIAGNAYPEHVETYQAQKPVTCDGVTFNDILVTKVNQDFYQDPNIDMTAARFNEVYEFDVTGNSADQFVKNAKGNFVEATDNQEIGTVTVNGTNVSWTLSNEDIKKITFDANGTNANAVETYIRYVGKQNENLQAYAKLVIPAGKIVKPVVSIDPENKIAARWYIENDSLQTGAKSGLTEIHVNPEVYGQTGANDLIYYNILNGFLNQTVKYNTSKVAGVTFTVDSTKFLFNAKNNRNVTGRTGSTYKIEVSADGKSLLATTVTKKGNAPQANKEVIATLSGTSNAIITYNTKGGVENLASYDILNYAGHRELGENQTFKAYIDIKAHICDWIDAGQMTVRFLRPVDFNTANYDAKTDAVDNGEYIDVAKLFKDPTDWRDSWREPYWNYYGIKAIKADASKAYTDADQTVDKRTALATGLTEATAIENLSTVGAANILLTNVDKDKDGNTYKWGGLHYENNNATIGNFHIYVPLTVTYDWGYEVTLGYARINMSNSVNNAKK